MTLGWLVQAGGCLGFTHACDAMDIVQYLYLEQLHSVTAIAFVSHGMLCALQCVHG